jgi:hypothetical protein
MVKVTWIDAWLDSDAEVSLTDIHDKLIECVDMGILIKKTKKAVVLGGNYNTDDSLVRFITRIPTVLVLKIEKATGFETIFEKRSKSTPTNPDTEVK